MSDAARARELVESTTTGFLSTLAVDPAGYPFGSIVAYALDDTGRPLLCISDLAEHARNLAHDPRASLLAVEAGAAGDDPLALGRVTLLGDARLVDGDDLADVRERWTSAHPNASYVGFADFRFWRLDVVSVRFVGGFGRMSWIGAGEYVTAAR